MTYRILYKKEPKLTPESNDLVLQDEQLGWINPLRPCEVEYRGRAKDIDYYGVTFDHLLDDVDGDDPEVLQINIIETEYDSAAYTNKYSQLQIDPREYILSECLPSIDAARHGEVQRITDGLMKMLMPDVWRNETGRWSVGRENAWEIERETFARDKNEDSLADTWMQQIAIHAC